MHLHRSVVKKAPQRERTRGESNRQGQRERKREREIR